VTVAGRICFTTTTANSISCLLYYIKLSMGVDLGGGRTGETGPQKFGVEGILIISMPPNPKVSACCASAIGT